MTTMGQAFRLGLWTIKEGRKEEFIRMWQRGAEWIAENHPGGGEVHLLQDLEDSCRLVSFATSTMPEKTDEVLARPGYQSLMTGVQDLLEEIEPHKMRMVGYAARRPEE